MLHFEYSDQVRRTLRACRSAGERRAALGCLREVERDPSIGKPTALTIAEPGDLVHRCRGRGWQVVYMVRDDLVRLRVLERMYGL